jgi:DNA-binding CsgD family transcriptional regulator
VPGRTANARAHEKYIAALAEERWARWEAGIETREDKALGALDRLLEDMGRKRELGDEPTERELEVLRLVAAGRTARQVADTLGISNETVKSHLKKLNLRLAAKTGTHAVAIAWRRGLID